MDRIERHRQGAQKSRFANEPEVADRDRPLIETPTGVSAETDASERTLAEEEVAGEAPVARARSEVTGFHDPGTDDETADGLTEEEEAQRRGAEDLPLGSDPAGPRGDVPVFDRGDLPPKV